MSQTYLPRQAAPVERTITGTSPADAGVEQSFSRVTHRIPFAGVEQSWDGHPRFPFAGVEQSGIDFRLPFAGEGDA